MRYKTLGDWKENGEVVVADLNNEDYQFLVYLHEICEWYICKKQGITEEEVNKFDIEFERNRKPDNDEEPGDQATAPYHQPHVFASIIERLVAKELGIEWGKYEEDCLKVLS